MSHLPKEFDPKPVEEKWYAIWEEKGCFTADAYSKKPSFCIVIPPPNVTGVLHMGHALVDTLQDILIRWKRMSGFETLWIPGTDHAGIATQTVVEKQLLSKTGKRRKDFQREEFLQHVWEWKELSEGQILSQLKKLGCSCDWSRKSFTMDQKRNQAVRSAFKKMYEEGLIYRGHYLVNWDPIAQTALSDDEVEHEEIDSFLWYIDYPVIGGGTICVATTRPETLLGDVAIAVHPKDPRYQSFIGKQAKLPLSDRLLPILADPFVDPLFGTGAVKITPGHDFNDFEIGKRHGLEPLNIMTADGKIEKGRYAALSMDEARKEILRDLGSQMVKKEPHKLRIGISYRSKAVIQPYLSKQWFVKMGPFKEKLLAAVQKKKLSLLPSHFESTYFHWIENLRDWCISRQLWWGHRIPIWYKGEEVLCYDQEGEPFAKEEGWQQDPDVLDTWFSSALWPLSTLGWPEKTIDMEKFYPTSTLITGHDILFFWVARMMLMGEYLTGKLPFKETFLHGLIYGKSYWRQGEAGPVYVPFEEKKRYDLGESLSKGVEAKWEKMSKSKGNIIDPLEISDDYGTDAMRFALCSSVTYARQIDLDRRRFEEFKNFANKIWNGARFVLMNLEDLPSSSFEEGLDSKLWTLEDRWILSRLDKTIEEMEQALTHYSFDKAANLTYDFFWNDFCSVYVETVKPVLFGKFGTPELKKNKQKLLVILLSNAIRLMHPIAPFLTEEIFFHLKTHFSDLKKTHTDLLTEETIQSLLSSYCILSSYPKSQHQIDKNCEEKFEKMQELIRQVRNIRANMQLSFSEKTELFLIGHRQDLQPIEEESHLLFSLTPTSKLYFVEQEPSFFGASAFVGSVKLFIPISDAFRNKEKLRLEKEKEKLEKLIFSTQIKLQNQDFCQKAPVEIVKKLADNLADTQRQLEEVMNALAQL